jgi:TolB protein
MTKKIRSVTCAIAGLGLVIRAQDVVLKIIGGEKPTIAITDFRGAGDAAQYMNAFNQTLYNDIDDSGLFKMAAKSMFPIQSPQQPSDFQAPAGAARRGPWLTDWSAPPVSSKYLAFGYAASQANQIVLSGWLFDVQQADVAAAQLLGKRYFGDVSEAGARKVAHEFAADIITKFGGVSSIGSHIYFVSDRSGKGTKEIWSMEPDGSNQKRLTFFNSTTFTPGVSPDGTKLACTTLAKGNPGIFILSLETGRQLLFVNPKASLNATPAFTPDGKQILFGSTADGRYTNIYMADVDGGNLRRISTSLRIEVEPKVNPKTGNQIVFVSGRSGPQQIWKMNLNGTDAQMLTSGEGDASNPAWHPNGEIIAFAWTRGFAPGNFNIFLMDVATRRVDQLTHGMGRNENPTWAPDGRHLVFASNRKGSMQIFTMLADGTHVQQLTTQGRNEMPVWGK